MLVEVLVALLPAACTPEYVLGPRRKCAYLTLLHVGRSRGCSTGLLSFVTSSLTTLPEKNRRNFEALTMGQARSNLSGDDMSSVNFPINPEGSY